MLLSQWAAWAFESVTGWVWHRKLRRETGECYMDRWQLIKSRWLCVYVNRINTPDYDDLPHNHPWPRAYSLKLRRGYVEQVFKVFGDFCVLWTVRRPPRFNRIPQIHRIVEVDPGGAWTLFIGLNRRGNSDHSWGFVKPDGSVIPAAVRKEQRGVTSEA